MLNRILPLLGNLNVKRNAIYLVIINLPRYN